MATETLVLDLARVDATMLEIVGGKAANLGEMIRAGLPVPPGVCVTTAAYRLAAAGADLDDVLHELAKVPADDVAALTGLAGRARAALLAAPVPDVVADAVTAAYRGLGTDVPVAVRSSATAEDLPSASFAGQQDTYLNVVGTAPLIDAVARCWASLWTDRAVVYRAGNGIDHRAVHLAVVVQRMVDAQVAGVLFTADPVTGRRRQAVIDAAPGLGEAVVSGAVNPDHFVVDTATGVIVSRRLGDKRVAVRARPGGGVEHVSAVTTPAQANSSTKNKADTHAEADRDTEHEADANARADRDTKNGAGTHSHADSDTQHEADANTRADRDTKHEAGTHADSDTQHEADAEAQADSSAKDDPGAAACLSDEQIRQLAGLGDRVEAHYRAPQDTEWAIDAAGSLWLTQARPVTTLYPIPAPTQDDLRVYFCFSVAQGLYRPITPMGIAALRLLGTSAAREFGFAVADPLAGPAELVTPGQRIFVDFTGIVRSRIGRIAMPRVLDVMEARSAVVMRRLFDDPRLAVTQASLRPFLRRVGRLAARHRLPVRLVRGVADPDGLHRELDRLPAEIRQRFSLPADATPAERLDLVEHALTTDVFPLAPRAMAPAVGGFLLLGLAGKLAGSRPGELQTVLRGLPHNVTTAMDLDLWRLARAIRRDPAGTELLLTAPLSTLADRWRGGDLPGSVQAGLTDFLHRYGERAVAEIDLGMPRWSDDPQHIIGVVRNYLRLEDDQAAPDAVFARGAAEAGRMVSTLVDRSGTVRGPLVRFALDRARRLAGLRELPKYLLIVALGQLRAQLRLVGEALTADARLAAPEDVFMLTTAEAREGLSGRDLHVLVAERRAGYDAELRRRKVPRVLLSDGTEPEASAAAVEAPDGALVGTAASAGTVTATARLVLDPVGAHLEPGEILVAPSTDPGWTPLFLTAGGLVMEMGGANSHGAVVAREYGIPAVVGVPDATTRIATGDRITLDGTAGTVLPALS